MLSAHQVAYLNIPHKMIDIIDLYTGKILQVNHKFTAETVFGFVYGIETFSKSILLCITERDTANKKHLRLTYYSFGELSEKMKPVVDWKASKNDWSNSCILRKINNYSKLGWWWDRSSKSYEIFS